MWERTEMKDGRVLPGSFDVDAAKGRPSARRRSRHERRSKARGMFAGLRAQVLQAGRSETPGGRDRSLRGKARVRARKAASHGDR